jgi:hypothetical protein
MADAFLNLDPILGRPRNRVARCGVELEGGWKTVPPGCAMEMDGSVFKGYRDSYPEYKFGEIPIGPIVPAALKKFMKKYYPHKVDLTCGMHVRMSFERLLEFHWLMDPKYQETILEYLTRWAKKEDFPKSHHIWDRLSGKSIFCQKRWWPDAQVNYRGTKDHDQNRYGHRYTIINYCGRTNAVEVRVLPMMDTVEQAIRAVEYVIEITNASLFLLGKKEAPIKGRLDLSQNNFYEELIEKVNEIPLTETQRRRLRND